jgi:hypothetical protein
MKATRADGQVEDTLMTTSNSNRALALAEIAAIVLLNAYLWLAYRRHQLRSHVQGAVVRWENDIPRSQRGSR